MGISAGWDFLRYKLRDHLDFPDELAEIPAFGSSLQTKKDGTFRLATQNANGTKVGSIYSGAEEIYAMEDRKSTRLNSSH
jgi:hypothetical protein